MDKKLRSFAKRCWEANRNLGNSGAYRRRLGIQLTEACPMHCAHCIFACTTHGSHLDTQLLTQILNAWRAYPGAEGVGFTGGEPFYVPELLDAALDTCHLLGLEARVATSAYWAWSPKAARSRLASLSGPCTLILSVDRHHQEVIPAKHIQNAVEAAREAGVTLRLMVTVGKQGLAAELKPVANVACQYFKPDEILISNMLHFGRAVDLPEEEQAQDLVFDDTSTGEEATGPYGGPKRRYIACNGLSVPLVGVDHKLHLCCASASYGRNLELLCRGSVKDKPLTDLLVESDREYWIVQCLRAGGPELLAERTLQGILKRVPQNTVCETCLTLFSDPAFMQQAYRIAAEPHFQEEVASLLWARGERGPMVKHFYQEFFQDENRPLYSTGL